MKLLILHGPNLNLLGQREQGYYGCKTLDRLNQQINAAASSLGVAVDFLQSNSEQVLVEAVQTANSRYDGIVLNPAGFGYSSIALKDAILAINKPVVEVHLSNIQAREVFRRTTVTSDVCIGQICGFNVMSYILGIHALIDYLKNAIPES